MCKEQDPNIAAEVAATSDLPEYVPEPPNDDDFDWGIGAEVENNEPEGGEPAEEQKGEAQ